MCFMRVMKGLTEKINNTKKLYSSVGEVRFSLSIFLLYADQKSPRYKFHVIILETIFYSFPTNLSYCDRRKGAILKDFVGFFWLIKFL